MIVIGITGTLGSGKGVVRDLITRFLKIPFSCVVLSDIVKEEVRKRGKPLTREILQEVGNDLRKEFGNHVLVELAVKRVKEGNLLIDGIRNPGEVDYLRKKFGKRFILIGVDAPPEIRFERIKRRGRKGDPKNWEDFLRSDERDLGINEPPYGQHVKDCLEKSDFLIINDKGEKELEKKLKEILNSERFLSLLRS